MMRHAYARAFSSGSCSSTSRRLKHSLRSKGRQAARWQVRAESASDEEAKLRADYGALSERIEVFC